MTETPDVLTPEQVLSEIARLSAEVDAHLNDAGASRAERDRLIRVGLELGIAGPALGKAAGFKRHQRIYQIAQTNGAEEPSTPV